MNTDNSTPGSSTAQSDEISLKELLMKVGATLAYLRKKWLILLIWGLVGALLGLTYSLMNKTKYLAKLTFVLEEDQRGGMGQASGLASMVGISLGGMEGVSMFAGENIMEFLKSKRMIYRTLVSRAPFDGKDQLLVERYVDIYGLREQMDQDPRLQGFRFTPDTVGIRLQDSLLGLYYADIVKNGVLNIEKPDSKLSIIAVAVESPDEAFSKVFCERLISNASDFYVRTRTRKSTENLQILTRQVDSIRRELNDAITGVAVSSQANPNANPAFQTLRVPSQKRQVDVQANSAILSELVKQQELARIEVRNSKPLVQVLDRPYLPLEKSRVGKLKGMVIGAFLFGFFTVMYLLARRFYRAVMSN